MTPQEFTMQRARLEQYDKLSKLEAELESAKDEIDSNPNPNMFHAGPFTGDTRESRKVIGLKVLFSSTLGGEPPTNMKIGPLHIQAWKLRNFLISELEEMLHKVWEEKEKL